MERKDAFKLECVALVANPHYSCESVSNSKGINESTIRKWVSFYGEYGRAGLLPRKNGVYSIDFKPKGLQSIDKELLSLREACLKLMFLQTQLLSNGKEILLILV